jgi:hypothetical protein
MSSVEVKPKAAENLRLMRLIDGQTFNGSATGWRGTQASIRVPLPGVE